MKDNLVVLVSFVMPRIGGKFCAVETENATAVPEGTTGGTTKNVVMVE